MSSRLEFVQKWEVLAEQAGYRATDLAALCQISLRTLERHFQKNYDLTVGRWLRELRLARAYEALLEGKTVKEVSYDSGYKQMSNFSRDFKAKYGISPSFLLQERTKAPPRQHSPSSGQMIFSF